MKLGDRVTDGALRGRVVANLDRDEFSADFPRKKWAYLSRGVLVETEEAGIVHYENTDELAHLGSS